MLLVGCIPNQHFQCLENTAQKICEDNKGELKYIFGGLLMEHTYTCLINHQIIDFGYTNSELNNCRK